MQTQISLTLALSDADPIAGAYLLNELMKTAEESENNNSIIHAGVNTSDPYAEMGLEEAQPAPDND